MPEFIVSSEGSPRATLPQRTTSSSKASTLLRITRYFTIFPLALNFLARITAEVKSFPLPPPVNPTYSPTTLPEFATTQIVQYQASLIRDNLPSYLDFISTEVLPVMCKKINDILYNLQRLTDRRPGFFYHGHID